MQFIEGGTGQKDTLSSDDEELALAEQEETSNEVNDAVVTKLNSLHLTDQVLSKLGQLGK